MTALSFFEKKKIRFKSDVGCDTYFVIHNGKTIETNEMNKCVQLE